MKSNINLLRGNSFLIHGIIFMENTTGPGVFSKRFSGHIDFSGIEPEGVLEDSYGSSIISCAKEFVDSFHFKKVYTDGQKPAFKYSFFKAKDGFWCGYWQSEKNNDKGLANCILTPYLNNFFDPISTIECLRSKEIPDSEIPLIKCFSISDILKKI